MKNMVLFTMAAEAYDSIVKYLWPVLQLHETGYGFSRLLLRAM